MIINYTKEQLNSSPMLKQYIDLGKRYGEKFKKVAQILEKLGEGKKNIHGELVIDDITYSLFDSEYIYARKSLAIGGGRYSEINIAKQNGSVELMFEIYLGSENLCYETKTKIHEFSACIKFRYLNDKIDDLETFDTKTLQEALHEMDFKEESFQNKNKNQKVKSR